MLITLRDDLKDTAGFVFKAVFAVEVICGDPGPLGN